MAFASHCHSALKEAIRKNNWHTYNERFIWDVGYKDALKRMDPAIVWSRIEAVTEAMNIKIHPSWQHYLKELHEEEDDEDVKSQIRLDYMVLRETDLAKTLTEKIIDCLEYRLKEDTLSKSFLIEYSGNFYEMEWE